MAVAQASGGHMLAYFVPQAWSDPTDPINFAYFTDVEVQIVGTPGANYTPYRSFDQGTTYVACNAYDKDGAKVAAISAAGIYSLPGGAMLKLTGGSGSTVYVRAGV